MFERGGEAKLYNGISSVCISNEAHTQQYLLSACGNYENGSLHVWCSMEGVLDLSNRAVSEKTSQIFGPPLPTENMTVISE